MKALQQLIEASEKIINGNDKWDHERQAVSAIEQLRPIADVLPEPEDIADAFRVAIAGIHTEYHKCTPNGQAQLDRFVKFLNHYLEAYELHRTMIDLREQEPVPVEQPLPQGNSR